MDKLLSMVGLAYKAGKIKAGTDSVIDSVRSARPPCLVIVAYDVSENAYKKIRDGCTYHGVQYIQINENMSELGNISGGRSGVACAAVLDKGFADRIKELANNMGGNSSAGGRLNDSKR